MAKKSVPFNKSGIAKLPDDRPVIYEIKSAGGKSNYIGIAKKGRVQERLTEHLPGGTHHIPGAKVKIEQQPTVQQAAKKEKGMIAREQPKYNKVHK